MSYPAALPAIAVLAGVVFGSLGPSTPLLITSSSVLCACLGATAGFVAARPRLTLAALVIGFFATGVLIGGDANEKAIHPPLYAALGVLLESSSQPDPIVTEGRLLDDAVPTEYGASFRLRVERVVLDGRSVDASANMRISVGGSMVGERLTEWRAGRSIRAPVTFRRPARYLDPGVPDQELALARRGVRLFGSVKSASLVEVMELGHPLDETAAAVRHAARRAVTRTIGRWSERSAAIVIAILIGDRAGLTDEVEERLQAAGTYHVIAISGGNIAILTAFLIVVLRVGAVPPRSSAAAALVVLAAYGYLVGGGASVVRATIAAAAFLSARLVDQRTTPTNALSVAAVSITTISPLSIFDAGFLLTFGATLAILLAAGPLAAWLLECVTRVAPKCDPRWIRPPLALLAATISVEIALLPISAWVFSRVSFAGVLLNFIAIPLMSIVQIVGMAVVGLAAGSDQLATAAGYVAHLAASGLVECTKLVDLAPWLALRIPPPPVAVLTCYYGAWIAWFRWRSSRFGRRVALAGVLAAGGWIMLAPTGFAGPETVRVTMLDVGQGDSILVQFPNRQSLLVDTGGVGPGFDIGGRVVVPALWALGVRRLDFVALTHGDPDHIGGAPAVLRDLSPREVWDGVPVPADEPLRALREQAGARRILWRTLKTGDALGIGAADIIVLNPPPPDWERQEVRNDDSLVLELRFGDVSFLFSGDISHEVEAAIARQLAPARIRIVKAAHHGSGASSSAVFVDTAKPLVAVFSAGRGNRYGHPAPYVLQRYRKAGAAIFRTDQDGAVMFETDGHTLTVQTVSGRKLQLGAGRESAPGVAGR